MRLLITALTIGLIAWLGGGTWYWVCKVKGHCDEVSQVIGDPGVDVPSTPTTPNIPDFLISYDGKPFLQSPDNLRFGANDANGRIPGAVAQGMDSLVRFLQLNPDKELEITGSYASDEMTVAPFNNLGLARADFIARWLAEKGLSTDRVIKSYKTLAGRDAFFQDTLIGGIAMRLLDKPMVAEVGEATESGSETGADDSGAGSRIAVKNIEPRDLYFEYKSFDLPMNDELRDYVTRAIQYVKQNEGKTLVLTGHTDNKGSEGLNVRLSRNRANTIKQYFTQFGLDVNRIRVVAKGEYEPVATNNTEEGRRKNRRVEIRIQ